jgi:parallel beta-helix repeat protein
MKSKLLLLVVLLGVSVCTNLVFLVPSVYAWTPLDGHLTHDTTLLVADSPYRIVKDVIVDSGVVVTIEPGVTVEFADGFSFIVNGTLYAEGTADNPINFTSSRLSPFPGSWNTIQFIGGVGESFTLKYSVISYAQNGITISSNNGSSLIEQCDIAHNAESGIQIDDETRALIVENRITQNGVGITSVDNPSGVIITNNTIVSNTGDGITLYGLNIWNVTLTLNTITSNGHEGISLYSSDQITNVTLSSNIISSNGWNGILFISDGDFSNVSLTENTVTSNEGGISFSAHGYLYHVLLSSNIVSSNNNDGLYLSGNHNASITYDVSVLGNTISANLWSGINVDDRIRTTITNNSISYNTYGIFYTTQNHSAQFNDIYSNDYGIYVSGDANTSAVDNYWGSPSGPYHESLNPGGNGNPVNGDGVPFGEYLDFIPFLSAPNGFINNRPTANLTADTINIALNHEITLNASTSTDDSRVDQYYFTFGDGTNSGWITSSEVNHNYSALGDYSATLTVMDDFGVTSINTANWSIIVVEEVHELLISLSLNTTVVVSERNVSVLVSLSLTDEIQEAFIQFVSDQGGGFTPSSGWTDSSGDFQAIFTAPVVSNQTTIRITATASNYGSNDGLDDEYLMILEPGTKMSTALTCAISESNSTLGSSITVTGFLSPEFSGKTITLTYTKPDSSTVIRTVTTGTNGFYTDTYTPEVVGSWSVLALWTGDSTYEEAFSVSRSYMINAPAQNPMVFYGLIIAAIAIVTTGALVVLRRKRSH